jgi:flagellar hook assembly protein FlgD
MMSNVTPLGPTNASGATNSTTAADNQLGPNSFLTLLTTELQNQDPDQPQDATESVTQLAQISELQFQQQLTSSFASFQSNFAVLQGASLIGKGVTVNTGTASSSSGNSSTVTGVISSLSVQNGQPFFTLTNAAGQTISDNNGSPLLFSTTQIVGIGNASAITGTNSSASSGI